MTPATLAAASRSSVGMQWLYRLGRRMLVPTHKLYALLGIPADQVTDDPIDEPGSDEASASNEPGL